MGNLKHAIFGSGGGATHGEVEGMARRDPLSDFLPYVAYGQETGEYANLDNTIGYLWECTPLPFVGKKTLDSLEGVIRMAYPAGAVLQFLLYADPHVEPYLARYKQAKTRDNAWVRRMVENYAEFVQEGTNGVNKLHGLPLRNFRLFVALKSTGTISEQDLSTITDKLSGAGLQPRAMGVWDTLEFLRRLLNGQAGEARQWDRGTPLRKQIIRAETEIEVGRGEIAIGNQEDGYSYARCLSPQVMPENIVPLDTNRLAGGVLGQQEDNEQIPGPFLWSFNIVFGDLKGAIERKASWTMMQKAAGSFMVQISKRVKEFVRVLGEIDKTKYYEVYPSLVVFGKSREHARAVATRAKNVWEARGYVMQEERHLAKTTFLMSLPFGFYATKNNRTILDRHHIAPAKTIARLLPVQADYIGSPYPVIPLVGRKGQVAGIDVFDRRSNNYNFWLAATSGAGKSFLVNTLMTNYYAAGAYGRIIDLGYSYEKLATVLGGRFLDFGKARTCINPFTINETDGDDKEHDLDMAATVAAEMVYSASERPLSETESTLVKDASRFAYNRDGGEYGIDHIRDYMAHFPKFASDDIKEVVEGQMGHVTQRAREMAINLRNFTSRGSYGEFFNGPTEFNIGSDELVVLEMEQLKARPELYRVAVMQVLNAVTQDLYLSDRQSQRFIVFEESWDLFGQGERLARMVEEGYRRARKYHGSFGVVTQSPLDVEQFGPVGQVIRDNSAWKFLMESPAHREAAEKGIIEYEGFALDILESIKSAKPRYSELMVDSPFGRGAARLLLDPYGYAVNTSDAKDNGRIQEFMRQGMDPGEAIERFAAEVARG